MKYLKHLALAAISAFGLALHASADTITPRPIENLGSVVIGGTAYEQYRYTMDLSGTGKAVDANDFIQFDSILGFVGFNTPGDSAGPVTVTGANGSTWNLTATPGLGVDDLLKVTYTGDVGTIFSAAGISPLVSFTFLDIYKDATSGTVWHSQDHAVIVVGSQVLEPAVGTVGAPDPTSGAPETPLPAAFAGGLGLSGLMAFRRSRRTA